jgi:hypothetical protein
MTAHDSSRRRLLRSLAVAITAPELCGLGPTASGAADEGRMPESNGAGAWLNSAPLSSTALHGKVVTVGSRFGASPPEKSPAPVSSRMICHMEDKLLDER